MKSSRYLVAGLGAATVCAFAVFAAGQNTTASSEEDLKAMALSVGKPEAGVAAAERLAELSKL